MVPVMFGAVSNVAVRGVTNTQAILTYTAPDAGVCSVTVSESPTYSPLVHDVDPTLFAGSNLDSRPESMSSGRSRVFVLGKRRAEKALNGHWYSRALQTVTTHYYKITCGGSVATGTFVTANLALGNTYNEAMPGDPAAGSRPYYATMGSYAWPEFTKWDPTDPTSRAETVVDPQTGVLLKRIGMPRDATIDFYPGTGDHNFSGILSQDGTWNIGTTVFSRANGKLLQISVGSGGATVTTVGPHGLTQDSRVTISGLAQGNGVYSVNSPSSNSFVIAQGSLPSNTVLTDATLQVTVFAGTSDNGSTTTNFSGTNSNFLLLRDDFFFTGINLADPTLPTDYLTLSLKGWCQGTCAGEDAKVQACLTINGVNCWPTNASAKYQEVALGTSQTNSFVTLGSTTPILDAWTPAGFQPLNKSDLSMRSGQTSVDTSGNMTWTSGATYFNPNWTTGSRITVAGVLCTVRGASSTGQMAIDPASCATPLALPLTNAFWSGNNLGFLIRKKTANTDTIRLQFAKYTSGASQHMTWTSSGAAQVCSETLVQNSVTGEYGYHCQNYANLPMLYWVEQKTARANYLGIVAGASAGGLDGFGNCYGNGTLAGTTPTAPERYYCGADDNETPSKRVMAECTINTTNQPGSLSIGCRNLTPGTQGKDLSSLMAAFTANDTPKFDTKFTCNPAGVQGTKLVISCGKSIQDTLAWVAMFDPLKVDTAPGCVGGGQPGCIVAAMSTWATSPARWCTLHTLFVSGNTNSVWIAGKYFTPNFPPQLADGPYTSNIVSGTLGATPAIAAGTGACPPGGFGCDQVTVDGEPCDPAPAAGEAAGSPCPKNPAYVYLQDAQVGDYVSVDSEYTTIVAKSGNVWTLQRGVNNPPVAHSSTTLSEQCKSKIPGPGSNWSWSWDTALDPHGTNVDGTTLRIVFDYDHPNPRPSVTVGGLPFYDTSCISGVGPCYGVRDGVGALGDPPNRLSALAPLFSGTNGTSQFVERSQDHPSRLQDAAPPAESKWFLDGRPLTPMIDLSDAVIRVSGDLYRMTSTTTEGDNLSKLGYNVYVEQTSPTTLLAAGNCSTANPCTLWNDTQYIGSIKNSCTITITGGTGAVWVSRLSTGELAVTRSSGLSVTSDLCPVSVGSGYPGGAFSLWSWTATSGVWAPIGSDDRAGSSGFFGILNRKQQATWAYCGTQPLIDVSSAATGDVIGDAGVDAYKYCVARKAGECRAASKMGDIYMNCPNATPRFEGSYGCHWYQDTQDVSVDMCVGNHSAYLDSIDQIGFAKTDFKGALGRGLTKGLGHYKIYDPYFHGKATPDAEWIMFLTMWVNGGSSEWLAAKTPPYPPSDTVDRSTFIPVPVKLSPPPGLSVNNVVLQFGYAENGNPSSFYCTSRQEKCLASSSTVPTIPFLYASEGAGGVETGITGLSCTNGCTVAVPAISQRVLYYQVIYRNAANQTLAKGQVEVTAVP
jgi:hypothetical protein